MNPRSNRDDPPNGLKLARAEAREKQAQSIIGRAIQKVRSAHSRKRAGQWLAFQLRDDGFSRQEALRYGKLYVETVASDKSGDDYTFEEFESSVGRAFHNGTLQEPQKQGKDGKEDSEGASHEEMTQAERLLAYPEDVELFHTPDGEAYASFEAGGAYRTAAISSNSFGSYLRRRFYRAEGRPPSSQALQDTRDVLVARAEFDGEEHEVHLRVAGHGAKIYIDLADDRSNVIEIDARGWRIIRAGNAPVRFRPTPGMKALPEPKRCGSLDLLRSHVRLASDRDFVLLLAWLVQALRPQGPYPVLELTGEQGSGKSWTTRLLRALVDPHSVPTRTHPREERDLMVAADNSWLLGFDNLSGLRHRLSDAFCRLATGGGFGTRRLYTDRGEELFFALRPLILNGIEDLTTRPDLADRTVTLRLEPIPERERQTEAELKAAFERDRLFILGALFDAVATALRNIERVELDRLPRMADFARWAVAAEAAFPVEAGTFIRAYETNRAEASEEAIANDTVAAAIQRMLSEKGSWEGIMSELLVDLKDYLPNPDRPPRDFPDNHQAMTARLRRVLPALRAVGIYREDLPRTSGGRPFRLFREEGDTGDTHDAMCGTASANRTEKN